MDINTITDIKELKSMAYDQLAIKEQAQANLQAINARIAEVSQQTETDDKPDKKSK